MGFSESKLNHREEEAIIALLTEPSVTAAAEKVGIADATMYRWLQQPAFKARYLAVRRQMLDHVVAQLQSVALEAVQTLTRNLTCGQPATEVRAAVAVLEQTVKVTELMELQDRLDQLEDGMQSRRVGA